MALVTGAARGLGQAAAWALAEAGAEIALVDRIDLSETAALVQARGRRSVALSADLSGLDRARADATVAEAVSALSRVDISINNAGIIRRGPAATFDEGDWHATLSVNLTAAFFLSQAFARTLLALGQPGKIVNVASMLSFQGGTLVPAYAAAKSGIAGITRALANEWAAHGINVNAIAPGYIATDLTEALRANPERAVPMLARIPAGRWGEPADVQGAIVFLSSDAAAYIHGAILPIDGGWLSS